MSTREILYNEDPKRWFILATLSNNKMFICFTVLQYSVTSVQYVFTKHNLFFNRFSLPVQAPNWKKLQFFKEQAVYFLSYITLKQKIYIL